MHTKQYIQQIRNLLAKDDIEGAIAQLKVLMADTPQLNEVLQQSGRYANISRQIRNGKVSFEEANVTTNQIRGSLLELVNGLVNEIETQTKQSAIGAEVAQAITNIANSKNVVVGSTIQAGGNVMIGDQVQTESETSKRLRLFLYLFVPLLALAAAFGWYKYQEMQRPLTLKVLIDNQTPNEALPDPEGKIVLTYGNIPISKQAIKTEALYEGIPPNHKDEQVRLQYTAKGFQDIDTTFNLTVDKFLLPVYRNDDLASIKGIISNEDGQGLEGVSISSDCCNTQTDVNGRFDLRIPFSEQRAKQRLEIFKLNYKTQSITTPVLKGEMVRYILENN